MPSRRWCCLTERFKAHSNRTKRLLLLESLESRDVPAPFAPGDLVIYRVGDGTETLANTGNSVFLDEYTPAGQFIQSIALPTTSANGNDPLVANGSPSAASEGMLTRSVDGRYLVLAGYGSTIPAASSLTSASAASVPRIIGRVGATGTIDTTTALIDAASSSYPRSVVSLDGSGFWFTGGTGGVRYATLGSSTSTQVSSLSPEASLWQVNVFNGQLYISDQANSSVRIGSVGTGTPTTSGQNITNLYGIPTATGSPNAFYFANSNTLYIADHSASGGIVKYTFDGSSWQPRGTLTASGIRGLTGVTNPDGSVTLYGTAPPTSATGNNSVLYSFTDTSGSAGTISGTVSSLLTRASSTNEVFRGIAFVPEAFDLAVNLPDGTRNVAYSVNLATGGATPYSYQTTLGSFPPGLNFDISTGKLIGTPTTTGTSIFTLSITDATGLSVSHSYSLTIAEPISVTSITANSSLANGSSASWAVTFSGAVSGLTSSNFSLTDLSNSIIGESISGVTPIGNAPTAQWLVTASTGTAGDGVLRLAVANSTNVSPILTATPYTVTTADIVIDRTPPNVSAPDLASSSDSGIQGDNITNVTTPTFIGTAEAGAAIELYEGATLLGTTTATGGSWSITSSIITQGIHTLFARATDTAGNFADSGVYSITIDTTRPTVMVTPSDTLTNAQPITFAVVFSKSVTGFDKTGVSLTGTASGLTTATIGVMNPSHDGRMFTVTVSGVTADGTVTLSVPAGVTQDTAGNLNTAGQGATVTLDTTPPAVSTPALDPASDSGIQGDNITNVTTPTFTGTAEAGATVELYYPGVKVARISHVTPALVPRGGTDHGRRASRCPRTVR